MNERVWKGKIGEGMNESGKKKKKRRSSRRNKKDLEEKGIN